MSEATGAAPMNIDVGHVVIIDGDAVTRAMLARYLNDRQVLAQAIAGKAELDHLLSNVEPSVIILDLAYGPRDGFGILRDLRSRFDVPIIVISDNRLDQADCVVSLELGADDYMVKPLNPRVVLARVRAVLRRFHMGRAERAVESERGDYNFDGWRLECRHRRLWDPHGALVPLSRIEYDLLLAFLRAPRRVLTRQHLLQATQMHQEDSIRRVDGQIQRLRRKLEFNSEKCRFIRTERGIGYAFTVAVVPYF
jgi:two-component system OmpR family response regulator